MFETSQQTSRLLYISRSRTQNFLFLSQSTNDFMCINTVPSKIGKCTNREHFARFILNFVCDPWPSHFIDFISLNGVLIRKSSTNFAFLRKCTEISMVVFSASGFRFSVFPSASNKFLIIWRCASVESRLIRCSPVLSIS